MHERHRLPPGAALDPRLRLSGLERPRPDDRRQGNQVLDRLQPAPEIQKIVDQVGDRGSGLKLENPGEAPLVENVERNPNRLSVQRDFFLQKPGQRLLSDQLQTALKNAELGQSERVD